jgi:hypothetical protein
MDNNKEKGRCQVDGIRATWHLREEVETGNKRCKASTKQEIRGYLTRELLPPARQYQGARLVHHDVRSLTAGGFLMGGPSVGARQD